LTEKLRDALTSIEEEKTSLDNSVRYKTPNIGKKQNKKILEEDGIKCFDLGRQSLLPEMNEDFDLRQSLGPMTKLNSSFASQQAKQAPAESLEIEDQLFMINELERLKKENEDLQEYISKFGRQSINETAGKKENIIYLENNFALREELEQLKEESLFLGEELQKYQRHSNSLADEVRPQNLKS